MVTSFNNNTVLLVNIILEVCEQCARFMRESIAIRNSIGIGLFVSFFPFCREMILTVSFTIFLTCEVRYCIVFAY